MVKYMKLGNKPEIEVSGEVQPQTAPYDPRFPNQNQTK